MVQYNGSNIPPEIEASLPQHLQDQIPLWHQNLQPDIYVSVAVCHTAACVAVLLRLYSRRLKCQAFLWDDYLIVVALVFNFVFSAFSVAMTYYGIGRHQVVTVLSHPERVENCVKSVLGGVVVYSPTILFTKYSVLMLYHRIFSASSDRFRWVCLAVGIFVTCYSIATILVTLLSCIPLQAAWDTSVSGKCLDVDIMLRAVAAINTLTDAVVLVLPMTLVWRMKTTFYRRLQVSGIFLLGSFVTIVSIVRAIYVGGASLSASADGFWSNSYPTIWSCVETGVAIVAACLPVMRPVLNKVFYGSVELSSRRLAVSEPLSRFARREEQEIPFSLVTIGGRVLTLKARHPSPGNEN